MTEDDLGFPTHAGLIDYLLHEMGVRGLLEAVGAAVGGVMGEAAHARLAGETVAPTPVPSLAPLEAELAKQRGTVQRLERVLDEVTERLRRLETRILPPSEPMPDLDRGHVEGRLVAAILEAPSKRLKETTAKTVATTEEINAAIRSGAIRRVKGGWLRCAQHIEGDAETAKSRRLARAAREKTRPPLRPTAPPGR